MDHPFFAAYTIARQEAHNAADWAASTADAHLRFWLVDKTSTDGTADAARAAGIEVLEVDYAILGGFRFDHARNLALDHLPDNVDVCVSLDADERLDPGFIATVRNTWAAAPDDAKPDKMWPWHNTGNWWRCDRVHSRHGWRWAQPCHETTVWQHPERGPRMVEIDATMRHQPDDAPRTVRYLPLLKLAVEESPDDARMWGYYARELWFAAADPADIVDAVERALELGPWSPEAAFLCRVGASAAQQLWLARGTRVAPGEAEAWWALARYHYDRGQWQPTYDAARVGLQCPQASHYLADQGARGWGLADTAGLAARNIGELDDAVAFGYAAWAANPLDGRLAANLGWYVREQAIPVYAVIPQKKGERVAETTMLAERLRAQGCEPLVDDSDQPIHRKWNIGLGLAETRAKADGHKRWTVIVVNNDVEIRDGFVAGLAGAIRSTKCFVACPGAGDTGFTGWCMTLRGEDGFRFDERFSWWYGDSDLQWTVQRGGAVMVLDVPVYANHTSPNESTITDPDRLAAAWRDEQAFADKWLGGDTSTLFLHRHADDPTWARPEGRLRTLTPSVA